jgi:hypothetical protein
MDGFPLVIGNKRLTLCRMSVNQVSLIKGIMLTYGIFENKMVKREKVTESWRNLFYPLKTEFLLNDIYKFRPNITGNTLRHQLQSPTG